MADLGGLGAREGPPVSYRVLVPNLARPLLPWILLLLLLALKPNRCASTWWILAPVLFATAVCYGLQGQTGFMSSSEWGLILDVAGTLAFGLAAVWLLSFALRRSHRFLTFLLTLVVMAGFSLAALVLRQEWGAEEALPAALTLLASTLVLSLAFWLDGWICRRRHGPLRLGFWLLGLVTGFWLLVLTPFALLVLLNGGIGPTLLQFLGVALLAIGLSFGPLLPFLLLSWASRFYRDRLKRLLHLEPPAPPLIAASALPSATVPG